MVDTGIPTEGQQLMLNGNQLADGVIGEEQRREFEQHYLYDRKVQIKQKLTFSPGNSVPRVLMDTVIENEKRLYEFSAALDQS